ncbi:MAG: AIPR family protein [Trueperella sp.]|uniref:AIPR family protein n=1 Tax=Trueperella sp. TaxID=2699835 RepID=UPI002A90B339|nr:AIPR family protein [Trueperella sp.]MDY5402898.1 AIPR family protein [Trueperella sp.]
MMAELHLRKIKAKLKELYSEFYDHLNTNLPKDSEASIWSKLLAGHALHHYGNAPIENLSAFVVDGVQDRGIDAVYYDDVNHQLTFVQSKWSSDGSGSLISEKDAGEFANGISEAMTGTFPSNANKALLSLNEMFERANTDYDITIKLVIISTSTKEIQSNAQKRIEDGLARVLGEDYELEIANQSKTYLTFSNEETGRGAASFELLLHDIGVLAEPYYAIYGWATGRDIADLVNTEGKNIFARNIRGVLGNTPVNEDIRQTVIDEPENFWYFNNGLTFLADDVKAPPLRDRATAKLRIDMGSIVNGAQTSSTLARLGESDQSDKLNNVRVQVRLISARNAGEDIDFPRQVTRFNNSQNGMGAKEFVSLDDFQKQLQKEIDAQFGRSYYIRSGTGPSDFANSNDFDLQTATIALTCARQNTNNVVRAKSGIGALWKDVTKPPYTEIFDHSSTTALALVKAVDAFKVIETFLQGQAGSTVTIDRGGQRPLRHDNVARHGNRLFQHAIMRKGLIFNEQVSEKSSRDWVNGLDFERLFSVFAEQIYANYPDAYLAYLFKNQEKCSVLIEAFDKNQDLL